jgi:RNA polymerase sigma-70 factor (ECF subfamily)
MLSILRSILSKVEGLTTSRSGHERTQEHKSTGKQTSNFSLFPTTYPLFPTTYYLPNHLTPNLFVLAKLQSRLYNTFAMDIKDDRELIKRCIDGNGQAWSKFVDRFSGLIYWAIKRKLNKYDSTYLMSEVEDIYQRIFTSIWEKKSFMGVSERTNVSPWLVVLASNFTIDYIRKKRTEENFLRHNLEEIRPKDEETSIFAEENKRLLDEAIKLLNEKEKAYIQLNYMAGKKHREIAEIFNTPVNSVSTIISRAKNKIKRYIESKNKV